MHIQRIRPSEIKVVCFYFMLMNCKDFDREESLNQREENLLKYLKDVSTFFVFFWHRPFFRREICPGPFLPAHFKLQ